MAQTVQTYKNYDVSNGSPLFLPCFYSLKWTEFPHDARHAVARADGIDGHLVDLGDLAPTAHLTMKYQGLVSLVGLNGHIMGIFWVY